MGEEDEDEDEDHHQCSSSDDLSLKSHDEGGTADDLKMDCEKTKIKRNLRWCSIQGKIE